MVKEKRSIDATPWLLSIVVAALMAAILNFQGRIWWCALGDRSIYINDAWNSSHTSQHFFDPYTFTHILHGVLFFWFTSLLFPRISGGWRFLIGVTAEAGWEILENSNYIIQKYRANTASLDYFGDSIANSAGDLMACAFGFWIAYKLGWWRSLIFFAAVEISLMIWIRDGLLLNILMLFYSSDAIKQWQLGMS
jgi:hypothetical protein